jgi:hypothetical protein
MGALGALMALQPSLLMEPLQATGETLVAMEPLLEVLTELPQPSHLMEEAPEDSV